MKEIIKELSGWLLYIVLIIALTWTVVTFVGQRTEVSGSSMETTLSDKDHRAAGRDSTDFIRNGLY